MKEVKRRISSVLDDENRDPQERLFLLQQLLLSVSMLVLFVTGAFQGESLGDSVALLIAAAICAGVGGLTLRYGRVQLFGTVCALLMIFIELPMTFFSNAGLRGGTPIWFVFCTLCISLIITGWKKWFLLAAETACVLCCYGLSYWNEELLAMHTRGQAYADSLASVLLVCVDVYLIVALEVHILRSTIRRAEEERVLTEKMNKAQSRFFSSMSHEIRTPVNAIISLNEMILREKISPEVEEDAHNVRASCKLLLNVVNDIVDLSKIESGNMEIVPTQYETGDMFSELVGIFWTQARDKGLDLRIDVAPDMPARLYGDEVRIRQVLVNLLTNAIKYTAEGSVTLNVQPRYEGKNLTVVYSVTDTGKGIRKESLPYLFSVFRHAEEDVNQVLDGAGLGLSIVKQLVDLMGGTISVNSVYSKGSAFVVELPQKNAGGGYIDTESIERRSAAKRKGYIRHFEAPDARVLVVDDNRTNLLVVQKLLRSTGVEVDTAESGEEALKKTVEKQYHLILMDHMMPEMDGVECLRKIRQQTGGLCREAKVAALTANAGADSGEYYAQAGFNGCLIKPIDSRALEQEVARLLPSELVTLTDTEELEAEDEGFRMQEHRTRGGVIITTDSVADLPQALCEKYRIGIIPSAVSTAGGVFRDGLEINSDGLIAYMDSTENFAFSLPPSKEDYEAFFADSLQLANNVVHVSMSGAVHNSGEPVAREAAESFENVTVVDSLSVSGGLGLLAIRAAEYAKQGKTPEQIAAYLRELSRRLRCSFVVDSLDYLARTRQINPVLHTLTETLMVHPVMTMSRGRIRLRRFMLGTRQAVWQRFIRRELRERGNIDRRLLLVTYTGVSEEDLSLVRTEVYKLVEFDEIVFQKAVPSITANCGKNTLGLFYLTSDKRSGSAH